MKVSAKSAQSALSVFQDDIKRSESSKNERDQKIKEWIDEYEGIYPQPKKNKSALTSKDIKAQSLWEHSEIKDAFVTSNDIVKCYPVTESDAIAARQNELLLNTQFCRQFPRYNFITRAIKILQMEGTLVVETGWEYKTKREIDLEKKTVIGKTGKPREKIIKHERVTVLKNQPTAEIHRNEDVYYDPTCMGDINKARFFCVRKEIDLSALKEDGRYINLDVLEEKIENAGTDGDYSAVDDSLFEFTDTARMKFLIYHYWGFYDINNDGIAEPIVCSWANDVLLRLAPNPFPDNHLPFIIVPFNISPFKLEGEPHAATIGDNQKTKTAMIRSVIENMAAINNGQVGVPKQGLDPVNLERFLSGKHFEHKGIHRDEIWESVTHPLPGSVFDGLALMDQTIEKVTGVAPFSGGVGHPGGLSSTSPGLVRQVDSGSIRRMDAVRNIAENLVKPLLRKWMSYNTKFLKEEEVVRITENEFVAIKRDDLQGRIDIDLSISTIEDNAINMQNLGFILQTLSPVIDDPVMRNGLIADFFELMRMPEKAEALRNYNPEPDPMMVKAQEMELKNLELGNKKLEAEIALLQSESQEDRQDALLKEQQTLLAEQKVLLEKAKVREIHSKSDLNDLKFVKEDNTIDIQANILLSRLNHIQKEIEENTKHRNNIQQMILQRRAGDTNIGTDK